MVSPEHILDTFVSVADTLVRDFDLVEFLHTLTEYAVPISGAEAAGILLADPAGQPQFMAASTAEARALELFQTQRDEGPCRDSFETGHSVVNLALSNAARRRPTFAPKAVSLGYESVHALPLRLRDERIGALNLFSPSAVQFDDEGVRIVQSLADIATIGIIQERSIRRAEIVSEQLQGALTTRIVIEQAKGALAQHCRIDVNEAFQLLRSYARENRFRLTDVCERAINEPEVLAALSKHGDAAR